MGKTIILPEVKDKLDELLIALLEKGYFGFLDSAEEYVNAIYDFIYSIPSQRRHPTQHKKYGAWYCRYKPNKHTTWYITFDTDGQTYLIRNIVNNHSRDYPAFIKGL